MRDPLHTIMSRAGDMAWRLCLALLLCLFWASQARAGLSVYTTWSSLPPVTTANQRTIDFGGAGSQPATLASEQTAGKITFSKSEGASTCIVFICTSGGSVSYTSTSNLTGFSGNVASLTSGTTGNATSLTINFTNPTAYVGLLWGVQFNAENTMVVNLTLADNTVVTLKNCGSTTSAQCIGKYVSTNWLQNILNFLLGWIFGDTVTYYPIYMQYQPDSGVKIKSMQIVVTNCAGCGGILNPNTSQDLKIDYITYVDTAVAPDHLELTTSSATATVNTLTEFKVKACGNPQCTLSYTSGVSGKLTIDGVAASVTNSGNFVIPAGVSEVSVTATMTSAGTATASVATTQPATTPTVYCGMGVAAASGNNCKVTVGADAPHHIALTTLSQSPLSCAPISYLITACKSADCATLYTGGVSGTFNLDGVATAFTIPAGASAASVSQYVTPGLKTASAALATPSSSIPVYCGIGATASSADALPASCNITVASAGFVIQAPNHVADDGTVNMLVSALSSEQNPRVCTPTFVSQTKSVNFKCAYGNPSSGTLPVRLGNQALNSANDATKACDGAGRAVSLAFNSVGVATVNLRYADVGQVSVSGAYTGSNASSDAGLSMLGSTTFTTVPASIELTQVPTGTIKAGAEFKVKVRVLNKSGAVTPNIGKESPKAVTLTLARTAPLGTAAVDGTLTGTGALTFTDGAVEPVMTWSEVGTLGLTVALDGGAYLSINPITSFGVLATALSKTGTLGPFVPDRFQMTLTPISVGCTFTFNEQPFGLDIQALNTAGAVTQNYDGITNNLSPKQAKAVQVAVTGTTNGVTGKLSNSTDPNVNGLLPSSAFVKGVASVTASASNAYRFIYDKKESKPTQITLTASESGPASPVVSSPEVTRVLRSGRLQLFNKFGSEKQVMDIAVQSQYWADKSWVINALDNCTAIPLSAVSLSGYKNYKGVGTTDWSTSASAHPDYAATVNSVPVLQIKNGSGTIRLSAPSSASTGSVDLAINLGAASTTQDASCLSTHGATTGAGAPWLRARNGSCSAGFDRDPSAKATFGIYTPETNRTIYSRELY